MIHGLGFLFLFLSAQAFSENLQINPENTQFVYQTYDDRETLPCTMKVENPASQDLQVFCTDGKRIRKYSVHLWITRYEKTADPKLAFEVLYWVTDRSGPKVHSIGSTVWFHFKDLSALNTIQIGQHVEDGMAGLYMKFVP